MTDDKNTEEYTGYNSVDVANELIRLSPSGLTEMQINKLTFIAHGFMLAMYDRPLTKDKPQIWKYGPMYEAIYYSGQDKIEEYGGNTRLKINEPMARVENRKQVGKNNPPLEAVEFDAEANNILEQIIEKYEPKDEIQISMLCNEEGTPWDTEYKRRDQEKGKKCMFQIIPDDVIEDYYKGVIEKAEAKEKNNSGIEL